MDDADDDDGMGSPRLPYGDVVEDIPGMTVWNLLRLGSSEEKHRCMPALP